MSPEELKREIQMQKREISKLEGIIDWLYSHQVEDSFYEESVRWHEELISKARSELSNLKDRYINLLEQLTNVNPR